MDCAGSNFLASAGWQEKKSQLAEFRRVIEWQEKEFRELREISGPTRKLRKMAKEIRKQRRALEGFERAFAEFETKAGGLRF